MLDLLQQTPGRTFIMLSQRCFLSRHDAYKEGGGKGGDWHGGRGRATQSVSRQRIVPMVIENFP